MAVVARKDKDSVNFAIVQQFGRGWALGGPQGLASGLGSNTGGSRHYLQHKTFTATQSRKDGVFRKTAGSDTSDLKFARRSRPRYGRRNRDTCHGRFGYCIVDQSG